MHSPLPGFQSAYNENFANSRLSDTAVSIQTQTLHGQAADYTSHTAHQAKPNNIFVFIHYYSNHVLLYIVNFGPLRTPLRSDEVNV